MTRDQISFNILNLYRGGRSSDDEHISLRQIHFNVLHYRALLVRRDFQRNGIITRHLEQELGCLELEEVNASRCCGLPLECSVWKTKKKIPRTIRLNMMEALTSITDPSGINTIPLVNVNTVQFLPYDRFTKKDRKAYMIEDYLYIYNPMGMDTVNIRGIFEDPTALGAYDCADGSCYDKDSDFPLPMDMVNAITEGLVKGTFTMIVETDSDTANDAAQDQHMASNGEGK